MAKSYMAQIPNEKKIDIFENTSAAGNGVGPGTYDVDGNASTTSLRVKGGVIDKQDKFAKDNNNVPAPNQYQINYQSILARDRSYSIGRTSLLDRGEVIPEGEFGLRSLRRNMTLIGPGSYSHKNDILKIRHPSSSIPRAERIMHEKKYGPGPVDYNPNKISLNRVSSCVFNRSTFIAKDERLDVPGPGKYNSGAHTVYLKHRGLKFNQALRNLNKTVSVNFPYARNSEMNPGPGHYRLN